MAISELWLPQPTAPSRLAVEAQRLAEQVQRTLPFAWVPAVAGALLAVPALASLNGSAQWATLGAIAMSVVWVQLVSLMAWSGSDGLALGRHEAHTTDDVLRPLRKQGWRVQDHVPVGPRTVDHVAVGRGGVLLLESRHRRTLTAADLDWAAHQAQAARRDALASLGRAYEQVPVLPVIVAWSADHDLPEVVGGVPVVHGDELPAFLARYRSGPLTEYQVEAAAERLHARSAAA